MKLFIDPDQFTIMNLQEEIAKSEEAYQENKENLEREYLGKIVAFCEKELVAIGDTIDQTLKAAEKKYPEKTFYFRRIGKNPTCGYIL